MKSLSQYINESIINESSSYKKCKTFKSFFKLYTGCEKPEELTEDDFECYDYGFSFNREDMNYKEFVKWLKSVWNNKISNVNIEDIGNTYSVSFEMDDETFDLDAENGD